MKMNHKKTKKINNYLFFKEIFDLFLSFILLIILFPFFVIISILIKLESKGPIIFKQKRVGKESKLFTMYKFRTMVKGTSPESEVEGPLFKVKKDPRTTKFGILLRRTCLDELPQLFNVLKGEMSLVGPRPHLASEIKKFKPWQKARLKVKPGITGLWQISGRHNLYFEKAMRLDIQYVKNVSFWLDFKILIKTIPAIIFSKGKW